MKKQFRKIDIVVFVFTGLVIIGMFLYLAIAWKSIPDRIPANFTTSGEILTYESKGYLFSVPIALFLMSSVLIVAGCIPSAWNIPKVKITPKNEPYIRVCIRAMIDIMLLLITIAMSITFLSLLNGRPAPLFPLIILGVLFLGNCIFWCIRTTRIAKQIGE